MEDFSQVREVADESMLGQRVRLRGWLYRRSETEDYIDLVLRDETGFIVCRFSKSGVKENTAVQAAGINERSSIQVEGVVNRDEDAVSGFRVEAVELELIDEAEDIDVAGGESTNFYRDINELWKYPDRYASITRIQSRVFEELNTYFRRQEWRFVDPPLHVNEHEEGSLFVHDDRVTDPLPFLEALAPILGKVYTVYEGDDDRVFEAVATWSGIEDIEALARDLLHRVTLNVAKGSSTELSTLKRSYSDIREQAVELDEMQFEEALDEVEDESWDGDACHALGQGREAPVLVRGRERRADDVHLAGGDDTVQYSCVAAPEGHGKLLEVFAFEQRPTSIIERLQDTGQDPDDYEWLMDLRRDGVVPHTGIRVFKHPFVRWIADVHHEKDAKNFYNTFSKL
ncbi:MAG: OB-fold nucleic acid binding domain-containing protein [Candidatus Nanohaloarchaea archaeon]|nr:OB-fold nucleic acid binding domain-containing protein [Candidatus Nanohaloarchaea archaeon]